MSYITFSSSAPFTLSTNGTNPAGTSPAWNGVIEYSTDKRIWTEWNADIILHSGAENLLYLRGIGNSIITGDNKWRSWRLTGSNISCTGNIENLLDYQAVMQDQHPSMDTYCFSYLFSNCTNLISAPELPATVLATGCYQYMFDSCTALTTAPELPATTLADHCYHYMFNGCTSLTAAPALPATTLAEGCYESMFSGCTSLTAAPALPATTLAEDCYDAMFDGCVSLRIMSALPATTLARGCY